MDSGVDCAFGYGVDPNLLPKAQANIPETFDWRAKQVVSKEALCPFSLGPNLQAPKPPFACLGPLLTPPARLWKNLIPGDGKEWKCHSGASWRCTLDAGPNVADENSRALSLWPHLGKGLIPYGSSLIPARTVRRNLLVPRRPAAIGQVRGDSGPAQRLREQWR